MRAALGRLYRGETNIDFIGKRKVWFALSGVLILVSGIALAIGPTEADRCGAFWPLRGLECGIEFKGGVQVQAPVPEDGPLGGAENIELISEVRDELSALGAANAQIQVAETDEGREVLVQTKEIADPEAQEEVIATVAETVGTPVDQIGSERIGSKWGSEITSKAVRALIFFLVVILAFISWRFEWKMGLAAIVALVHDLIITAGVYSIVGFEVTPSTVIAILTILGYSLYDTVVVFDKVEENTAAMASTGRATYQQAANLAMNQVVMRSLNTSLTTLLPIAALLFVGAGLLGAETLKDLALALLIGILAGTYSSIFVATPVLSMWKEHEPRYKSVREKVLRDAQRAAPVPVAVGASDVTDVRSSRPEQGVSRPPQRERAGSKKVKRRKKR